MSNPKAWSGGPWINKPYACCGSPGGLGRAAYATLLPCCAAGDIAARSGRTYFLDCGAAFTCAATIAGTIQTPAALAGGLCCAGLFWASTRDAVVDRFGIQDNTSFIENWVRMAFCAPCHLIQELNEIETRSALRSAGAPAQQEMGTAVPIKPVFITGEEKTNVVAPPSLSSDWKDEGAPTPVAATPRRGRPAGRGPSAAKKSPSAKRSTSRPQARSRSRSRAKKSA